MSKAILVIDVDDELGKKMHSCDFVVTDRYGSKTIYPVISYKPMPQKKMPKHGEAFPQDMRLIDQWKGYDMCIDEILGEEE